MVGEKGGGNVGLLGLLVKLAEQETMEGLHFSRQADSPLVLRVFQKPKSKHLGFEFSGTTTFRITKMHYSNDISKILTQTVF